MPTATGVQLPPQPHQSTTRHSLRRLARNRITAYSQKRQLIQQQKSIEKQQHQLHLQQQQQQTSVVECCSILSLPSTSASFPQQHKECQTWPFQRVFQEAQSSMRLDLSARKFKEIPSYLIAKYDLADTLLLDLSDNCLIELPEFIETFANLRTLVVQRNQLSHCLSPVIQTLQTLTYLDLSDNFLCELPNNFYESLQSLQVLILAGNQLKFIDSKICCLSRCLQELDVSSNQLTTISNKIGLLNSLRVLNLSRNQLTELPPEIGKMEELIIFDASYNSLMHLPVEFRYLAGSSKSRISFKIEENPFVSPPLDVIRKGRHHIAKWLRNLCDDKLDMDFDSFLDSEFFARQNLMRLAVFGVTPLPPIHHLRPEKSSTIPLDSTPKTLNSKNICSPLVINTILTNSRSATSIAAIATTSNSEAATLPATNSTNGTTPSSSGSTTAVCGTDSGYTSTVDEYRFSHEYNGVGPGSNSLEEIEELNSDNNNNNNNDVLFLDAMVNGHTIKYPEENEIQQNNVKTTVVDSNNNKDKDRNCEGAQNGVNSIDNKDTIKWGCVNVDSNKENANELMQKNTLASKLVDATKRLTGAMLHGSVTKQPQTIETSQPCSTNVENNCNNSSEFNRFTVSEVKTISHSRTKAAMEERIAPKATICVSLTDDETQSCTSATSSLADVTSTSNKNESQITTPSIDAITTTTTTTKKKEVVLKDIGKQSLQAPKFKSKLAPSSSTLPRRKLVANSVKLKSTSTSSSTSVSTEHIPKKIGDVSTKCMGSTANLNTRSLRQPTPTPKLASKRIENNGSAVVSKSNIVDQPTMNSRNISAATSATISNSRINSKYATTNRSTSAERSQTAKIQDVSSQKSNATATKAAKPLSSSIKMSISTRQMSKSTIASGSKSVPDAIMTSSVPKKQGNGILRTARGISSMPSTAAKTISQSKMPATITINKKTASTTELIPPLIIESDTTQSAATSLSKLFKKYLPETRLDANNLDAFAAKFSSGVLLCRFANKVQPRIVPNVLTIQPGQDTQAATKSKRNAENFLNACRRLGVSEPLIKTVNAASIVAECRENLPKLSQILNELHTNNKQTLC